MKKKIIICALCLLTLVGGFSAYKWFFKNKENKEAENESSVIKKDFSDSETDVLSIEPIDAEEYLNRIGKIRKQYSVSDSQYIMTESDTITMLKERGFDRYPVTTSFSMKGEYSDQNAVSADSSEKHPIYETYYSGDDGSVWKITVVNDAVFADPIMYNFQEELEVPVVLSEKEYIVSYDNVTNKFYELEPNADEICIKTVDEINADLLKGLTMEGIDQL